MAPPSLTYRRVLATIAASTITDWLTALDTAFSNASSRWLVTARQYNGGSGALEAIEVKPPLTSPLANMRLLFAGSVDGTLTPKMVEHSYEANVPLCMVAAPAGGTISGAAPTLGTWSTPQGSGGPYGASARTIGFVKIASSSSAWRELMILTSNEDCAVWCCTSTGVVYGMPWAGAAGYAPGTDSESERVFSLCTGGKTLFPNASGSQWWPSTGTVTDWVSGANEPKCFVLKAGTATVSQVARASMGRVGVTDKTEHNNRIFSRLDYIFWPSPADKKAFVVRGPVVGRGEWRQLIDSSTTDYWVVSGSTEGVGSADALLYPVLP